MFAGNAKNEFNRGFTPKNNLLVGQNIDDCFDLSFPQVDKPEFNLKAFDLRNLVRESHSVLCLFLLYDFDLIYELAHVLLAHPAKVCLLPLLLRA